MYGAENIVMLQAEGKKMRDDKEKVMEKLFSLFEKHQYYNIKVGPTLSSHSSHAVLSFRIRIIFPDPKNIEEKH